MSFPTVAFEKISTVFLGINTGRISFYINVSVVVHTALALVGVSGINVFACFVTILK